LKAREISEGDTLLVMGDRTGVVEQEIQSLWVDDKPAQKAVQGEECTVKMDEPVRDGDNVYIWKDRA
jgi:putative protease